MTSVRLTENQEKKIKESNLTASEFVRRAVDYYILHLENPYNDSLLFELEQWIKTKRVTGVTHNSTTVTTNDTNVTNTVTNVTNNDTDVTNTVTNVTHNSTNVTQTGDTTQKSISNNKTKNIKTILLQELPMIQRMLNNPENAGTIPDYTLKTLSKRYDISKSTIQAFIVENKTLLKDGKFDEIVY